MTKTIEQLKEIINQRIESRYSATARFFHCDCGSRILHSNGGNYHEVLLIVRRNGDFMYAWGTTCELVSDPEDDQFMQLTDDVIMANVDIIS